MSYISHDQRVRLDELAKLINSTSIRNSEELSYLITLLTHRFLNEKPEDYVPYCEAVGALESVKLELYRRHVGPYEDEKKQLNGDV